MVRVKMLLGNKVCVIDEDKAYIFDSGGRFEKEDSGLLPMYTTGALSLPIVSILSDGDYVEVALFANDTMQVVAEGELPLTNVMMKVQSCGKFIRMLSRRGTQDGVAFNQVLYVYAEESDITGKIQEAFRNG